MQVSQSYGFTRPAAIAAKVERFRSLLPIAAPVMVAPVSQPRCLCCAAAAAFFLCDEAGKPLPRHCGGYCLAHRPWQVGDDPTPEIGRAATLETVEALALDYDGFQNERTQHALLIESFQVERETLRRDLETLHAGQCDARDYGGDFTAEIEEIESRLNDLDDYLVFEPDTPFIFGFDDLSPEKLQTLVLA
jgi:hypothetical protein